MPDGGGCLIDSNTSNDKTDSMMMIVRSTGIQYYYENGSAISNSTNPQNEEDANLEEYYRTPDQFVLVTSPYKWHETCFCFYTVKDWFPEKYGGSFFCKIACDADKRCKGFLDVGNGCGLATTSPCPDGCRKYFEGNHGNIIKDIPFSTLLGGNYFLGRRHEGCYSKA